MQQPKLRLTFDLTVMKGAGSLSLCVEATSTREAECSSMIRLVCASRAWLAWFKAITGVISWCTLTFKSQQHEG